jgi:O-antigen/teichoic acid export membrane protein
VRNGIYGFSTWILPLALSFIATPIIVRSLGHEDYGIYALVLGFIAYSFNFNIGRAITKYVAEYRAGRESGKIREIVSATLFINLSIGGIGLLLIFSTGRILVADVLKIAPDSQEKTVLALHIAALTVFFLTLNQFFNAILQGLHRFDVYAKIYNLNNILLISGNLGLALAGFGLLPLLSWNLLITGLSVLGLAWAAKRLLPEFSLNLRFPRAVLKLVLKYSSGVIAYQVLSNVFLLFERAWITSRLGAESLTFYIVPLMLALYIHSFIASFMMVVFPLASALKAGDEKLLRLYQKATKIVCLLVVFLGATLIVVSEPFLTVWMGAEFARQSAPLLVLHALTISFMAAQVIAWQVAEGMGYPSYNFYALMICFIICVSGMVGLIGEWGVFGVALARTVGFGVLFLSIFYVEKRFLGGIQIRFWLKLLGILSAATVAAVFAETFLLQRLGAGWAAIALTGFGGALVYGAAAWLLGFVSEDEIATVKGIFKR